MDTPTQHTIYRDRDLPHLLHRMNGDEKHYPASQSTLDVVCVPYHDILAPTPATVTDLDRDRLNLSRGHDPVACHATPVAHGYVLAAALDKRHCIRLMAPQTSMSFQVGD